jgi:hypothetical protein
MTVQSMFLSWIQSILAFIKRNPAKIGILAIISIVVSVYLKYSTRFPLLTNGHEYSSVILNNSLNNDGDQRKTNRTVLKSAHRSRILLRIRKQFDLACRSFLPTLKKKIMDAIDINHTIRQIKELRANMLKNANNDPNNANSLQEAENELWENVKVCSFAQLLMTLYLLSGICTLLRIQLHVLARSFLNKSENISPANGSSSSGPSYENDFDSNAIDGEMFKYLVEGTYKQLFSKGLRSFAAIIMERVKEDMQNWRVHDKVNVDYDELRSLFLLFRKNIETNHFDMIVKELFIRKLPIPFLSLSLLTGISL